MHNNCILCLGAYYSVHDYLVAKNDIEKSTEFSVKKKSVITILNFLSQHMTTQNKKNVLKFYLADQHSWKLLTHVNRSTGTGQLIPLQYTVRVQVDRFPGVVL